MLRLTALVLGLLIFAFIPFSFERPSINVGSKAFTESVVLGEMLTLLVKDAGDAATHRRGLGGTQIAYQKLLNGEIDVYPDMHRTLIKEVFANRKIDNDEQLRGAEESGVRMSKSLGFNNTYALGMLRNKAESLGIEKISDLNRFPDLRFGSATSSWHEKIAG